MKYPAQSAFDSFLGNGTVTTVNGRRTFLPVADHSWCRCRSFSSGRRHDVWGAGSFRESRWNSYAVASGRDVGLVIPAAGLGHLDSLSSIDGLCAFVDAPPSRCRI